MNEPGSFPPDDVNPTEDHDSWRGWVAPEHRPWRHPSEMARAHAGSTARSGPGTTSYPSHQSNLWHGVAGALGAAVVLAAGLVLAFSRGSTPPEHSVQAVGSVDRVTVPAEPVGTTPAALMATARRSLVIVLAHNPTSTELSDGVAVGTNGLILVSASTLADAQHISAESNNGRPLKVKVIAVDDQSDLALLKVNEIIPVARFADDGNVYAGQRATVLTLARSVSGTQPQVHQTTIEAVGAAVANATFGDVAAIEAQSGLSTSMRGGILMNADGAVVGLLDPAISTGHLVSFLPSSLLQGVADELATSHRVRQGWLGIVGTDTNTAGGGALVVAVEPNSAGVGQLAPGDIIEAVDGSTVRTMAELRCRLYVLEPSTPVKLTVRHNGTEQVVTLDLSPSP